VSVVGQKKDREAEINFGRQEEGERATGERRRVQVKTFSWRGVQVGKKINGPLTFEKNPRRKMNRLYLFQRVVNGSSKEAGRGGGPK